MRWTLALHGGAGAMRQLGTAKESAYREGLNTAALAGAAVLNAGYSAVEAVIAAVRSMESSGVFNAGAGSGLTRDGCVEVDGAVMVASDTSIGAVAGVASVENAVELAEAVRVGSPHVLLVAEGAVRFAKAQGVTVIPCPPSSAKLTRFEAMMRDAKGNLDSLTDAELARYGGTHDDGDTVGAICVDSTGEIACASSTGGIWLKQPGRVGDTPLAGPGFWCEAGLGAALATGVGEFIIKGQVCSRAVERLTAESSAQTAAEAVISELTERFGGDKIGTVLLRANGDVGFAFDTAGMGRALIRDGWRKAQVAVWPTETL